MIRLVICFIALIECITYAQNNTEGIYSNWLYIIYAYISIAFSMIARKYDYLSMYGYLLFVAAYMVFAFVDTLVEFNVILSIDVIDNSYTSVMITLTAILIFLSCNDRVDTEQHRVDYFMPKHGPNSNLHSEVSKWPLREKSYRYQSIY